MSVAKTIRGGDALLEEALPRFLVRQRWFAGKARSIASVRVIDTTAPGVLPESIRLTLIEVAYSSGRPDSYFLPIGLAAGSAADRLERESPGRAIARLDGLGL